MAIFFSQAYGLFPRRTPTFFTQLGVFSLGMDIAQKVIGWSYNNLKEIRSWGATKYVLVYSKRSSYLEICFEYFWMFSI